jgi:DNA-directed RNA polymerase subunit alpha
VNNIKHEFSTIQGLREDMVEVICNLKEIVFQSSFFPNSKATKWKGFLNIQGPLVVTAGMFQLPKHVFKILNPHQYICTLVDSSFFYMEIDIEQGVGYELMNGAKKRKQIEQFHSRKPSTLLIDAIYMPIRKVNYKIKLIHDTQGNLKESLWLEIFTNGSISPQRSLHESLKILLDLVYPIFLKSSLENVKK